MVWSSRNYQRTQAGSSTPRDDLRNANHPASLGMTKGMGRVSAPIRLPPFGRSLRAGSEVVPFPPVLMDRTSKSLPQRTREGFGNRSREILYKDVPLTQHCADSLRFSGKSQIAIELRREAYGRHPFDSIRYALSLRAGSIRHELKQAANEVPSEAIGESRRIEEDRLDGRVLLDGATDVSFLAEQRRSDVIQ